MSNLCHVCDTERTLGFNKYCAACANWIISWFEDMKPADLDKAIEYVKDELIKG